jgi:hypothetical protein
MADGAGRRWLDRAAGPVVRPYALTGGRTVPVRDELDLVALVGATRPDGERLEWLSPEQYAIVAACQRPCSVAEVAALVDLPLGVVRVLLGDLLDRDVVTVRGAPPVVEPSQGLLDKVIEGLRAL